MRVGLGATQWARGTLAGHLDGIGVYTKALWESLHRHEVQPGSEFVCKTYAFGNRMPDLKCGRPEVLANHFPVHALCSTVFGAPRRQSEALRQQIDLFHATDHHIPRLRGIPVVANVMDLIPLLHPEWVSPRLRSAKNWLFGQTVRGSDHIITISEYSKRDLIEHLGVAAERISVTPLGVDPVYFERIEEAALMQVLQENALRPGFFLCVGTLQPRKNLERVLTAHQSLPAHLRKAHPLVVVGRAGWRAETLIPQLRALESRGEGRWLDYLPRNGVLALLQSASAVVFPSLYEGFGLPVIEAFAARCPVITSNTTSLPEVAGDAALLVDPLDESAIAAAMNEVLAAPDQTAARVQRGVLRARTYSWDACGYHTLDVYRRVIQQYH
ncbi:glycosyltransferase family 4 protein [Pseudomonas sp. BGr12]|uniref:glycosyltransferase family 4 protein n=1 Tax=Pseudomonas sp. BGr12 TaxID=2936269 RepID=UPI002559DE51|nr:glycosyltransferase family 1 protein [Pseudomonas sp. BJa5]MDL2427321.1 glycosyltransferase family 4 protein [Pseudomonas sp. BJa5]